MTFRFGSLTLVSFVLSLAGCAGKGNDTGGLKAFEPGCSTAPACGSCGSCYEKCFCEYADADLCNSRCGSSGSTSAPPTSSPTGTPTTSPTSSPTAAPTSAPPSGSQSVTLKTDFIDVAPGGETFQCQNYANPIGKDVDILYSESHMTPGSHHMFAFREPGLSDGPLQGCGGLEFTEFVHSAQTPDQVLTYPAGVGRFFPASDGIRILAHYLNTGTSPLHAQVTVTFNYVDTNQVQYHAAQIFLNNATLRVPPGQSTVSHSYSLPQDIKLLGGVSHMHRHATGFTSSTSDGRVLYEGTDWNEPKEAVFDPPMEISAGTRITWACTYNNTSGSTLTFGESAATNEMCIFSGTFYPAPGGNGLSSLF